jgi:hypothetical protein
MKQLAIVKRSVPFHSASTERRGSSRLPVSFKLMYSGITRGGVLIGDGTVVDLSKDGLGIQGNYPVRTGMELTMFLYLPDGNDPLFVLEANVVRTSGNLFGVEFKKMCLREGNRLQSFLRTQAGIEV